MTSIGRLTNGTATTTNICFPAGTLVYTDQGEIAIEKINTSINTINNMSIDKITKTFSSDSKLVLIKKDAFSLNKPIRDTLTSCLHKFRHNGVITEAYKLINGKTIQFADYKGQALYNVLLKTWEFIKVNNNPSPPHAYQTKSNKAKVRNKYLKIPIK